MTRSLCAALLAAAVSATAAGCAPPDEPDRAVQAATVVAGIGGARRPVAPEVLPPAPARPRAQPSAQPSAQPTVISHVMAPQSPVDPVESPPAAAETRVGLSELSHRIEDVIGRLDLFVEESLRLQQSLLRLHLRSGKSEPATPETPDLTELPVGL